MSIRYEFAEPHDSGPVTTPPTCSVYVNGVRLADGQLGESDDQPVVLTDLKVTWGRSSTLDQPAPGTCAFRVMDLVGGQTFLEAIAIGDLVDIHTDGTIFDGSSTQVPMLPAAPLTVAYVTNGILDPATGYVAPVDGTKPVVVFLPPAALSSDPSAWNTIPRSKASQPWHAEVTVTLQTDLATDLQRVELAPVSYVNPNGSGSVRLPTIAAVGPGGGVTPHLLLGDFQPPENVWVGLAIVLYPTGPVWDDVDPAVHWDLVDAGVIWASLNRALVSPTGISLTAPIAGTQYSALVFSGRVTDLTARYDLGVGGTLVDVIAQDNTADLANRFVGDTPWLAETLGARFGEIVALTGSDTRYTVDPGPAGLPVTWRDVDSQPSLRLLQELAISAAGVLWSATDLVSGPYLHLEDIGARPPLYVLAKDPDDVVRIHPSASSSEALEISACSVLLEPVEWIQATDDNSTRVAVGWREQTLDTDGNPAPTGRTVTAVDAARELVSGRRRVGVQTELSTAVSAQHIADLMLARVNTPGWRISGLTWRMGRDEPLTPAELLSVLRLLDGTTRVGMPILLVDLPSWSPVSASETLPLYLEGGRYTSRDGFWSLELLVSSAQSQGQAGAAWNQLPADWLWNQFDPTVAWSDLAGVGVA